MAACADDTASCPTTIAAYCADVGGCPMTLDAARDPASWGCGSGHGPNVTLAACGDVHVATTSGVDSGNSFYYDASGKLYRVDAWSPVYPMGKCQAGGGEARTCNDPSFVTVCQP